MAERLKRIGTGTILLPNRPGIAQTAAIVGKRHRWQKGGGRPAAQRI